MKDIVLDKIRFSLDLASMKKQLHIDDVGELADQLEEIVEQAQKIGRPKAICRPVDIQERGENFVVVQDVRFDSRVLSVNLKDVDHAFFFIATCGAELEKWARTVDDILFKFWIDHIQALALAEAIHQMELSIEQQFEMGPQATMTPGALEDWSLDEQEKLFSIFRGRHQTIDVELTESNMMLPVKSLSGVMFPSEHNYSNCQLCSKDNCPNRRAEYEQALFETRYQIAGSH